MNELKVLKNAGAIVTNFEEVLEEVKNGVKKYKGLTVTIENLSEMKDKRKELTKLKKGIDRTRIDTKKEYMKTYDVFADKCGQLVDVIEDAESDLKDKTDKFDNEVKAQHLKHAQDTARSLAKSIGLEEEYFNRLDLVKNFENLTMTEKKIEADIDEQIQEQMKLQTAKYRNIKFVDSQLITASKLASLSTPLILDDVSHLIDDYETLDTVAVTEQINNVALRRKEAEELAIEREKEKLEREAEAKARDKAERIAREEREKIAVEERAKAKVESDLLVQKMIEEEKSKASEIALAEPSPIAGTGMDFFVTDFDDDVPEEYPDEAVYLRIKCKRSEAADIIRDLTLDGYDVSREE